MKLLISVALILGASASFGADSKERLNYQCIASVLQSQDSDNYYNLSANEIDEILRDRGDARNAHVAAVAAWCRDRSQ